MTAGLLIGNYGRRLAMSKQTRANLDNFWELLDEMLNAMLFVLIGLQVLVLDFKPIYILSAFLLVPVVLARPFFQSRASSRYHASFWTRPPKSSSPDMGRAPRRHIYCPRPDSSARPRT